MIGYLALSPILLLLLTAVALITLRLLRPAFAYSWLIAAFSALLVWILVLFLRGNFPQSIPLLRWEPGWLFTFSPVLLVDQTSWVYAFCISTLLLSTILTDAARQDEANWFLWTGDLLIVGVALAAVLSGNLLTLLLLWTAIDLIEGTIFIYFSKTPTHTSRALLTLSIRIAGTLLLIWAMLYAANAGTNLEISQYPPQAALLLLAAAFLRSGVVPLQRPDLIQNAPHTSLDTVARLSLAATSLVLVTRVASVEAISSSAPYLGILFALVAVLAGVRWSASPGESDAQPYWILGLISFSLASALRAQPDASLAWGVLALLTGGLIFLISARNRYLVIVLMIGLVSMTVLPYTPSWNGVLLYSPLSGLASMIFLISQSIFMAGYLRFALRGAAPQGGLERWVWIIYPWGLVILILSQYIIGWQGWYLELNQATVLPGVLACLLTGGWVALAYWLRGRPRSLQLASRWLSAFRRLADMRWIYAAVQRLYRTMSRAVSFIDVLLEGEGGILWALFFLVLFVAILTQIRLGV